MTDFLSRGEADPFVARFELKKLLPRAKGAADDVQFVTSTNTDELLEAVSGNIQKAVASARGTKVLRALNELGDAMERSDRDELASKIETNVKTLRKKQNER